MSLLILFAGAEAGAVVEITSDGETATVVRFRDKRETVTHRDKREVVRFRDKRKVT